MDNAPVAAGTPELGARSRPGGDHLLCLQRYLQNVVVNDLCIFFYMSDFPERHGGILKNMDICQCPT
jgi:hypothetical protein